MVVFFAAQNGAGAVDLFGQDEAYQLVRENQFGETPLVVRSFEHIT